MLFFFRIFISICVCAVLLPQALAQHQDGSASVVDQELEADNSQIAPQRDDSASVVDQESETDNPQIAPLSLLTAKEFIEQITLMNHQITELTRMVEVLSQKNSILSEKFDQLGVAVDLQTDDLAAKIALIEEAEKLKVSNNKKKKDTAKTEYQDIFALLRGKKFDEAETELKTFIKKYPNHALTADAYYWLGESFYFRDQYVEASESFIRGFRNFPKHKRASFNLLKLGMSLAKLEKKEAACTSFLELKKKYPNADRRILGLNEEQIYKSECIAEKKEEG